MSDTVPEGWLRVPLKAVASIQLGKMLDRGRSSNGTRLPYLRNINVRWGGFDLNDLFDMPFEEHELDKFAIVAGDVLVCEGGEPGRAAVWREQSTVPIKYQKALHRVRMAHGIEPSLLVHQLTLDAELGRLEPHFTGTTIKHFTRKAIAEYPFNLPPLAEQRRIVAAVEGLLARVQAARGRLEKVPAILKRFRQSVLAAACSGRLTEDWRERNGASTRDTVAERVANQRRILWEQWQSSSVRRRYFEPVAPSDEYPVDVPEEWALVSMDAATSCITSGSRDWKQYYRDDAPGTFIMAQNVRPLHFDRSYRHGVDPPIGDRDRERSRVHLGDLLVTIVGANTGDVCRIPESLDEHYVCQSVALMRPVDVDMAPFLELWLNSPMHGRGQYERWIYGEGRPHLSFDHLKATAVALPSLAEQQEIVRRVESLFRLADRVEQRVAAATARTGQLTQAILAKAFRGELVPTEAELARREGREYEPAAALLERVRGARALDSKMKTRNRRSRNSVPG